MYCSELHTITAKFGFRFYLQLISTEFYSLLMGIMIHEVLCSFALGVSLAQQKTTSKRAFVSSVVLASSIPMGMSSSIVVSFIFKEYFSDLPK